MSTRQQRQVDRQREVREQHERASMQSGLGGLGIGDATLAGDGDGALADAAARAQASASGELEGGGPKPEAAQPKHTIYFSTLLFVGSERTTQIDVRAGQYEETDRGVELLDVQPERNGRPHGDKVRLFVPWTRINQIVRAS